MDSASTQISQRLSAGSRVCPSEVPDGYKSPKNPHALQLTPLPSPQTRREKARKEEQTHLSSANGSEHPFLQGCPQPLVAQVERARQGAAAFLSTKEVSTSPESSPTAVVNLQAIFFSLLVVATKTPLRAAGTMGLSRNLARIRGYVTYSSPHPSLASPHMVYLIRRLEGRGKRMKNIPGIPQE